MDLELRALLIEEIKFSGFGMLSPATLDYKDVTFKIEVQIDFYSGESFVKKFEYEFLHEATKIEDTTRNHQIKSDVKKWAIDKLFN